MALKKTNTKDVEMHHVFALIVGEWGAGKTFAIGTLPEKETVILSAESGLLTLNDKSFEVWQIESVEDLVEAYQDLKKGTEFKNICVDSLTEITEICFKSLKPKFNKSQTFAMYQEHFDRIVDIIKAFRDLIKYNTFVTCLLKEKDNGELLDVGHQGLGGKLPTYFDFCLPIRVFEKDGKITRAIVTDHAIDKMAKSRSNKLEQYEKVDLTAIINKVMG